ncbi:MAG: RidA family protein [Clostridia bacterium]|nr:RidA family protein [Clostridia bacterium]MBQ3938665.1 RidA family protein [Clostridia bacterium]MBR4636000.1 RidA family protein [Clostridia bacterium]
MKQVVNSENAPKAIGPYSHCVKVGKMVFTSGQIGLNPETGALATGVEAQTIQAINNLKAVLEAAGSSLGGIVKTTVFVKNMSDFAQVNKLYGMLIPEPFPARSCVEVAALPAGALVEIEAMAVVM